MIDKEKLKSCPFCGAKVAKHVNARNLEDCIHADDCYEPACLTSQIVCDVLEGGCGAATGYYTDEDDLIAAWNRRAEDD